MLHNAHITSDSASVLFNAHTCHASSSSFEYFPTAKFITLFISPLIIENEKLLVSVEFYCKPAFCLHFVVASTKSGIYRRTLICIMHADLKKEREGASFPVQELTYVIDGGKSQHEKKRKMLEIIVAEPALHKVCNTFGILIFPILLINISRKISFSFQDQRNTNVH